MTKAGLGEDIPNHIASAAPGLRTAAVPKFMIPGCDKPVGNADADH